MDSGFCQSESSEDAAKLLKPRWLHQALYHVRHDGIGWVLGRGFNAARAMLARNGNHRVQTPPAERPRVPPLNLQAGELVEVKSLEEIRQTLDASGRYFGLLFLPNMEQFCGKRFRVHKRLERMYLEHSGEIRTMKNTVLLSGVHCDGLGTGCDRCCFVYWREAWLKRVPESENQ